LLRISGPPLPTLSLGKSDTVRDGQGIAFTGFPLGTALGFYPVTHRGIVASLVPAVMPGANADKLDGRIIQGIKAGPFVLFQLDATTFPGHSGSPLYDAASAEVVGIVNMGFLKGTKDSAVGQPSGISFAVPVQYLQELINAVR
jgi:S1-C subfamily serine protease